MEINNNQETINETKKIRLEQIAEMDARIAKCDLILKDADLRLKSARDAFEQDYKRLKLMLKSCNSNQKTTIFLNSNNQQFKEIYPIDFSWKRKLCKSMLVLTGYFIGAMAMVAGVSLKMADALNQQDGLAVSVAGLCLILVLTVGIALNYLHNIDKKLDQNNNISSIILYNQTNDLSMGI